MRRVGFLSVFFFLLIVAFAIAVFVRIQSHKPLQELSSGRPTTASGELREATPQKPMESVDPLAQATASARDYEPIPLLEPITPAQSSANPVVPSPSPRPAPSISTFTPAVTATSATVTLRQQSGDSSTARSVNPQQPQPANRNPETPRADRGREQSSNDTQADASSDSTPPRLLGIEFLPPQIADGEETQLVIHAADDLSGIRSISGTILAPSGAMQGFSVVREGDSNRFVTRVPVPKEAADGVWVVNYLSMMDNASNTAALTAARGTLPPGASFRVVSSRPDSQGPTLEAIWLDKRSMRGGEKNLIHVRATDDKSGVNLISGIFRSPSQQARIGFACRSPGDSHWTCELAAPSCADCGDWRLEQLQMQDKANNITTLRAAQNELVASIRLDISSDLCDSTPPAVHSVALDQNVVSNAEQSTILVTVRLRDDACGVLSVSGQATGPQSEGPPPRLYVTLTASAGDPGTWNGRLAVPRLAAKGSWRISFIQVVDRGQNMKSYAQDDPLLAGATFLVQ